MYTLRDYSKRSIKKMRAHYVIRNVRALHELFVEKNGVAMESDMMTKWGLLNLAKGARDYATRNIGLGKEDR